jgi:hypothetical protein
MPSGLARGAADALARRTGLLAGRLAAAMRAVSGSASATTIDRPGSGLALDGGDCALLGVLLGQENPHCLVLVAQELHHLASARHGCGYARTRGRVFTAAAAKTIAPSAAHSNNGLDRRLTSIRTRVSLLDAGPEAEWQLSTVAVLRCDLAGNVAKPDVFAASGSRCGLKSAVTRLPRRRPSRYRRASRSGASARRSRP